jgi:hypothetical protein
VTAYADRLQRLTGGEPSLRVRPRARFEPVPASSEPLWDRAAGAKTGPAFELAGEAEAEPTTAGGTRLAAGRLPEPGEAHRPGRIAELPAGPQQAVTGESATAGTAVPATTATTPGAPATAGAAPADSGTAGAHPLWPAGAAPPAAGWLGAQDDGGPEPGHILPAQAGHGEGMEEVWPGPGAGPGEQSTVPGQLAGWAGRTRARAGAAAHAVADPAGRRPALGGSAPGTPAQDRSRKTGPGPAGQEPASSGRGQAVSAARPSAADQAPPPDRGGHLANTVTRPSVAPRSRPVRYLAAAANGPGAGEFSAGDLAPTGVPGPRGSEREPAGPRPGTDGADREVTVTIGRIDVRVGPPQPAPSTGAQARAGSAGPDRPAPGRLEDYLRARSSRRVG